jgi:hypothetical protein
MSTTAVVLVAGTVLGLLVLALLARPRHHGDGGSGLLAGGDSAAPTWLRPVMQALITTAILAAALWVILSKNYDAGTEKWAYSAVGAVLGFWLRDASS